jgi:hypothetical protein
MPNWLLTHVIFVKKTIFAVCITNPIACIFWDTSLANPIKRMVIIAIRVRSTRKLRSEF